MFKDLPKITEIIAVLITFSAFLFMVFKTAMNILTVPTKLF